jgi:ribonuclease P protein component
MAAEENGSSPGQLAVVCPGALGNAVARNRIRRQTQALIREIWRYNNKNMRIVIRYKKMAFAEAKGEIERNLGQWAK